MSKKVPLIQSSQANRPRNAFDLSQRHLFTAHAGMLLPVLTLDCIPHDHVEINATDFMRTLPMRSAAFASMRSVYEFFFVPYHQLYPAFDQFITGMNDFRSQNLAALMNMESPKSLPYFNLKEFYNWLYNDKSVDQMGYSRRLGAYRLLDLLGYGRRTNAVGVNIPNLGSPQSTISDMNFNCSPFRILAYNKIYQDFYRNSHYETCNPSQFSIDDMKPGQKIVTSSMGNRFSLCYRNVGVDYATNVRPTPMFHDAGFDKLKPDVAYGGLNFNVLTGVELTGPNNGKNVLTVDTVRAGFALDKMLRISMRAGKTYAEQMAAHFGVQVPVGRDFKVHYIGGFDSNIQVSDVTQTSGTSSTDNVQYGGYLGRVTGKATGSGSGHIEYDVKEHGILMCIYSVVPDMQYDCFRVDPFNVKLERGQYFQPEFENLGLQVLHTAHVSTVGAASVDGVLGWQPRYSEYKTALDVNHGQFAGNLPLSYWSVSRMRSLSKSMVYGKDLVLENLKINPAWLNSIFAVDYNGTEVTDAFFGGCTFNVMKVSDMSVDGLPRI